MPLSVPTSSSSLASPRPRKNPLPDCFTLGALDVLLLGHLAALGVGVPEEDRLRECHDRGPILHVIDPLPARAAIGADIIARDCPAAVSHEPGPDSMARRDLPAIAVLEVRLQGPDLACELVLHGR